MAGRRSGRASDEAAAGKSAEGFADGAAYLEAQVQRIRLLLRRAVAILAGRNEDAVRFLAEAETLAEGIANRLKASEKAGQSFGLELLRKRFALEAADVDVLLHAVAATLDPSFGKLHTKLSATPFHPWLDVGLAVSVQCHTLGEKLRGRERFSATAPLIRHRLITLDRSRPTADENLLACEIKLPVGVLRHILGSDPTGGAQNCAKLVEPDWGLDQVVLSEQSREDVEQLVRAIPTLAKRLAEWGYASASTQAKSSAVLIVGPSGTGKTTLSLGIAKALGKRLLIVDGARIIESGLALEGVIEELVAEAQLQDALLLFDDCESLLSRNQANLQPLFAALEHGEGLVLLTTSRPERLDGNLDRRLLSRLQLELPTADLREKIWRQLLLPDVPMAADIDPISLSKRYELTGAAIKSAILFAVSKAVARGDGAQLTLADLDQAAQAQMRGDLSAFADRTLNSTLTLDSLVLAPEVKSQIEEVIAAGRNRGRVLHRWGFGEKLPTGKGLVVLLSGDPGTGKTLAAEVIAAELSLRLYRINPAKIVSKYVGETEKNLNEVLVQAKSTHSMLFFDEADAMFGARVTKAESSNDRFANMETNFLLQQLERFEGIVILATNLDTSIDQAFKRRIAYHITVPFPEAEDRARIWKTLIPANAPVGTIDHARLGKTFALSGGHIKNAILRAAYAAAQKGTVIDDKLLAEAAELECAAAGKLSFSTW